MGLFSITGTIAAIANYRKAKKEYEQACLEDNTTAVLATIQQYNTSKYAQLDQYDKDDYVPSENSNILLIPIINGGMMVGKLCKLEFVLIIQNVSDIHYKFKDAEVTFKTYGEDLWYTQIGKFELKPRSQVTMRFVVDRSETATSKVAKVLVKAFTDGMFPITEQLDKIREQIRRANQYGSYVPPIGLCRANTCITSLGQSVPPVSANVWFSYNGNKSGEQGVGQYKNVRGTFCYKGEAFHPHNSYNEYADLDS